MDFTRLETRNAQWLERRFKEEEIQVAVFALAGDKAPDPDGFPLSSAFGQKRIQRVLSSIISHEQGAFEKGRQILDGVLLGNECLHSINRERLPGLICKLDLEKACDTVDSEFLDYLLLSLEQNGGPGLRNVFFVNLLFHHN